MPNITLTSQSITDHNNRRTDFILFNLYNDVAHRVPVGGLIFVTFSQSYQYQGSIVNRPVIHVGYAEPIAKPDYTFFFCIDPESTLFKRFFVYWSGLGYEFDNWGDYFHYNGDYFAGVNPPTQTGITGGTTTPVGMTVAEIALYTNANPATPTSIAVIADSVTPTASVATMVALTETIDQNRVYVVATNSIYTYNISSTFTIDGVSVIAPANGIGRWLLTNNIVLAEGGSFL